MGFLKHIQLLNRHEPGQYIPFIVDGLQVGLVRPVFARHLKKWPAVFAVEPSALRLVADGDMAERSRQVATVLSQLVTDGLIPRLLGENYTATSGSREQGVLLLDRVAAPYFGIRAFGQHINGFVREAGEIKMWVAKRSADRQNFPGRLDNMAAGGLPYELGYQENLLKECWEEAGIPAEMAGKAVPVGAITYNLDTERGFKPDTLYCYDLELPLEFQPRCTDGEVESFSLKPVKEVLALVRDGDEFKPNCSLVVIDFMIRHGFITPEDPEYPAVVNGLRSPPDVG
ncbi:MAG: DUF4743 domain-containing protein [Gammaproteobacteria bacterium]|nr:DUF4743 domain-containing protein [Gammaproteobacteria bacterium]